MTTIRTTNHPETGEVCYALADLAKQAGVQHVVVARHIPPNETFKTHYGTGHKMVFVTPAGVAKAQSYYRLQGKFDLSNTRHWDGRNLKDYIMQHCIIPTEGDCFYAAQDTISLPGYAQPQMLRRALYALTFGAPPPGNLKLKAKTTCARSWEAQAKREKWWMHHPATCINPHHQILVENNIFTEHHHSQHTPAAPSSSTFTPSLFQEFLLEQGPFKTAQALRDYAAHLTELPFYSADEVESLIEHLEL